jgi:hypothetical protein
MSTARIAIANSARTRNSALLQQNREKIPKGNTNPTGPFVRVAHVVRIIARSGTLENPRSHQAKRLISAPAILVARIVSTRHVEAARNHSEALRSIRDETSARCVVRRREAKTKKPIMKEMYANADGRRAVASVTALRGRDMMEISQCEKGGFDGTAPS